MVQRSKQSTVRNKRRNKFNVDNYIKIIKTQLNLEITQRIYVKGYGFLSFAKNMSKSLSIKYGQKFDSVKKSTTDAIKAASKTAIQKTAEATGNLIGNKTV